MSTTRFALASACALVIGAGALLTATDAAAQRSRTKAQQPSADEMAPLRNPKTDTAGLNVGDSIPPTTVYDRDGAEVDLNSKFTGGLTVVFFYRGGWCPYCNKSMKEWGSQLGRFKDENIKVIAISPETPEHTVETAEKDSVDFPIYADATTEAMRNFGVAFQVDDRTQTQYRGFGIDLDSHNASGEWILPAPAFFLIDEQGRIVWKWSTWDYTARRASPDDVLTAARDQR
ncbi:MAG: peroxiredoxin-like family protein [Phycisphaerales bacterium]